jgi:Bacterial protein of unknown function (Gcw_chp)
MGWWQLGRVCLAVVAVTAGTPCVAGEFSASLVGASDYIEHGLTRSLGKPSLRVQAGWYGEHGFNVGAAATTLNLNAGPGPAHEFGLYVGQSWRPLKDWRFGASLAYYDFGREPSRFFSYDYSELKLEAEWRDLARIEAGWSPDYSLFSARGVARERRAVSYQGSLRYPATQRITLVGGLGHYDLRDLFGTGYWFWSGGIELVHRQTSIAVSYVGTDGTAHNLFRNGIAGRRVVAAIAWHPSGQGQ